MRWLEQFHHGTPSAAWVVLDHPADRSIFAGRDRPRKPRWRGPSDHGLRRDRPAPHRGREPRRAPRPMPRTERQSGQRRPHGASDGATLGGFRWRRSGSDATSVRKKVAMRPPAIAPGRSNRRRRPADSHAQLLAQFAAQARFSGSSPSFRRPRRSKVSCPAAKAGPSARPELPGPAQPRPVLDHRAAVFRAAIAVS